MEHWGEDQLSWARYTCRAPRVENSYKAPSKQMINNLKNESIYFSMMNHKVKKIQHYIFNLSLRSRVRELLDPQSFSYIYCTVKKKFVSIISQKEYSNVLTFIRRWRWQCLNSRQYWLLRALWERPRRRYFRRMKWNLQQTQWVDANR